MDKQLSNLAYMRVEKQIYLWLSLTYKKNPFNLYRTKPFLEHQIVLSWKWKILTNSIEKLAIEKKNCERGSKMQQKGQYGIYKKYFYYDKKLLSS